jgi:hypothetical protein
VVSVHTVSHLLNDLRAGGKDQQLLDAVLYRLHDEAAFDRPDMIDTLEQTDQKGTQLPLAQLGIQRPSSEA